MSAQRSETSCGLRYAILADCLDREADGEADEVIRAWRRYEAAVLRDLGSRAPKSRAARQFDRGIFELAQPQLKALLDEATAAGLDLEAYEKLVADNFGAGVRPYLARFLEEVRPTPKEPEPISYGGALKEAIGRRLLAVLEECDNPKYAMEELAAEAERIGLIDTKTVPRRDTTWEFVMDLWDENPAVLDRVNLHSSTLDPESIVDLSSALDALR